MGGEGQGVDIKNARHKAAKDPRLGLAPLDPLALCHWVLSKVNHHSRLILFGRILTLFEGTKAINWWDKDYLLKLEGKE